jgi:hypothetical protein
MLLCALALLSASSALVGGAVGSEEPANGDAIVYLQPSAVFIAALDADADADSVADLAADALDLPWTQELPGDTFAEDDSNCVPAPNHFTWQVGPSGLIYRSYLAGPHEPRIGITPIFSSNHALWDATVGGRGGILRYGDCDPLHPQGWQLDVYGAAIVRMDAENHQDLDAADYVFGFPITYGVDNWQFKFGYAHLSSHLGDEFAIRNPNALDDRVNYVRDGIVFGSSWFPVPACRLYGEFDWAFHNSGGANPIALQFGNELSRSGPTGLAGTPFLAVNGRLRQEADYGGDVTAQSGWLWRGDTGKAFRLGAHYYNGKSSQAQFFKNSEEQVGMGLWYDF